MHYNKYIFVGDIDVPGIRIVCKNLFGTFYDVFSISFFDNNIFNDSI